MMIQLATKHAHERWIKTTKAQFPTVTPRCVHVGQCGGCTLQDLAYEHQLALKRHMVQEALRPLGLSGIPLQPMADPWRYRHKMELSFTRGSTTLELGLHAAGSFARVIDIGDCWLAPEPFGDVMVTVREAARRSGLPPYDVKRHEGFWRFLILRYSRTTGQLMLCVFTNAGPRDAVTTLVDAVRAAHPEIATAYWGVCAQHADVARPESLELLAGPPYLREQLGPLTLDLHPLNFVQPNLIQATWMYATIAEWLRARALTGVWDLYAGIGCIGFYLAHQGARVTALESDPNNVAMLRHNAALNRLAVTVQPGEVEWLLRTSTELPTPQAIVVDPPRAGLHKEAIRALGRLQPQAFVYVSCNLRTLVPNVQALLALWPGYRIIEVQACDMFPHTTHVETLVLIAPA